MTINSYITTNVKFLYKYLFLGRLLNKFKIKSLTIFKSCTKTLKYTYYEMEGV